MKRIFLFPYLCILVLFACNKDIAHEDLFIQRLKISLKDSMPTITFDSLDFSRVVQTRLKEYDVLLVRVGYKSKKLDGDFVLIQADEGGNIKKGRIVHLRRETADRLDWNGTVLIRNLNGEEIFKSLIEHGYIKKLHSELLSKAEFTEYDQYIELPEVLIVSSYAKEGFPPSDYYLLLNFFSSSGGGGGGGGGSQGSYSDSNPYNSEGAAATGGGGRGGDTPLIEEVLTVDFETQYSKSAINIEGYMKCFSNIPDLGSTGSIEIFTDIPVNGNPLKFFNWDIGSPGHVFIQLKKQNGSQSVSQNIGFYPVDGWKTTITTAPIKGKFVDNQNHEFNASMKITLNSEQIRTAVTKILRLSRFVQYDIDDYNCTDWALEVFNETVKVSERLIIPKFDIPGGIAPYGTNTPQGLYIRLKQLKEAGVSSAKGITIPLLGWAGWSKGTCQ